MSNDSDPLNWTLAEAPPPDEAAPAAPPVEQLALTAPHVDEHRPHLSRRTWMMLGGSIVLAILGVALVTLQNRWQTEADIRRVVTLEEQAARNRDLLALTDLLDPAPSGWISTQASWVAAGQLSPLPDPVLRLVADAPSVIHSITQVTTDTMRAEAARVFVTPDGTRLTFLFAQFYRYVDKGWRRTAIPSSVWSDTRDYVGERLTLTYPAVDAAFALEAGTFINNVLVQACEQWKCPSDLSLHLTFLPETLNLTAPIGSPVPNGEPLLFAQLRLSAGSAWEVPSPRAVGYPADMASADWLKRSLAVQALARLANQRVGLTRRANAYLYALVARQSARLGLDSFQAISLTTASSLFYPEELWDMAYDNLWGDLPQRNEALRSGLAQLNHLLATPGLPADAEMRLSDELLTTFSPDTWLAAGLRLTPDVAAARLNEAVFSALRFTPPGARADLIFSCNDGLFFYNLARDEFSALRQTRRAGSAQDMYVTAWSPDGAQFIVTTSQQRLVVATVNLNTGEAHSLPLPNRNSLIGLWPVAWASHTILVLIANTPDTAPPNEYLTFIDVAAPERTFPSYAGVQEYWLSPDKTTALIGSPGNQQLELALMPALGGPLTPIGAGNTVAWSPDGQTVAYTRLSTTRFQSQVSLRLYHLPTRQTRVLWESEVFSHTNLNGMVYTGLAFAPDGQSIALAFNAEGLHWMGLLSLDGVWRWQTESGPATYYNTVSFSANGDYVASSTYTPDGPSQVSVFEANSGVVVRQFEDTWSPAWSATGHRLATAGGSGLFLTLDPAASAEPHLVFGDSCTNVLWNPAP